ncbi:MAG: DNRLRE domain-containing protein [Chloroflexota bacterium]
MPRTTSKRWTLILMALLLAVALWSALGARAGSPAPAALAQDDLGFSTVEIRPSADTIISYWFPDTNYGTGGTLLLRTNDETSAMFKFPLTAIPYQTEQVRIAEATLRVYALAATNSQALLASACAISRTWNVAETTWRRAAKDTLWETAGANAPSDRLQACGPQTQFFKAAIWYDVDVTDMVRGWVSGSLPNQGLILKSRPGGLVGYSFNAVDHVDASRHPYLRVVYTILPTPTPTSTPSPTPTPLPRVDVSKTGPSAPLASGTWATIDYSIVVRNPGGQAVTGVVVTDVLPLGTEFVQATDGGQSDNAKQYVVWHIGSLPAGASRTLGLTLGLPVWVKGDGVVVNLVRSRCVECSAAAQAAWEIPVVAPPIRTYYLPLMYKAHTQ